MKNVYKFVRWDVKPLEEMSDTFEYKMMEKLNNGEKLSRDEKESLIQRFNWDNGVARLLGWLFDFTPYTKRILVNTQYSNWQEMHAFDKTCARELARKNCMGKVYEIVAL